MSESEQAPWSSELAHEAVEGLDVGVLVVERDSWTILFRNAAAEAALRPVTGDGANHLPETVAETAASQAAEASTVPGRFTPAVRTTLPDGRRVFLRVRLLDQARQRLLLTIATATLRERDLRRMLSAEFGLNAQDARVAHLAAQGYRNREIAKRLDIVEGTVKNYLTRVYEALGVRSRAELISELYQLLDEQTDVHRRGG